jgi:hypothetical protein
MFASKGDITAPWGVSLVVATLHPSSITPALSHLRIQPQHSPIRNAVFQKLQHPVMVDFIEERRYVCIQYPVHVLALDPDRQRIQRIVLRPCRNPYENPRRSSSYIVFSTVTTVCCTTLSSREVIPSGRCLPSALGMNNPADR